ncbi:MAG: hypothetical protein RLY70_1255 [Planctomycetota bacterium]|jgi:Tfp pilus assembly protein PilF
METRDRLAISATIADWPRPASVRGLKSGQMRAARLRALPRAMFLVAIATAVPATSGCSSISGSDSWRWPWQSASKPAPANPFVTHSAKPGPTPLGTPQTVAPASATEWPDEKRAARDLKLALAQMLEQQGAAPEAIEAYENVLRSEPGHTAVAHRLAVLLDKSGQPQRAEPYYQACLRATPSDPDLLSDFAYHCYLERRWAEAENHFQRALAIDPRHTRARNNLGLVLARTERPREAFNQFAGGGCSTADAHANVAFALAAEARFEDAEQVYAIALQADPQNQRARDGLAALRQARRVASAPRVTVPHADAQRSGSPAIGSPGTGGPGTGGLGTGGPVLR